MSAEDDDASNTFRDPLMIAIHGAVEDGADEDAVMRLPRLLRFAYVFGNGDPRQRLIAEMAEVVPDIAEAATAWCEVAYDAEWAPLAGRLDTAAVERDLPICRGFADVVRMISFRQEDLLDKRPDALRVIAALRAALREASRGALTTGLAAGIERMILGWALSCSGVRDRGTHRLALVHYAARELGQDATRRIRLREEERARPDPENAKGSDEQKAVPEPALEAIAEGHVIVCPSIDLKASAKAKDAVRGHEHVVGKALPLVPMPDLVALRRELVFEFPYAEAAIDVLLAPMFGRAGAGFPPVMLVGPPGAGKTRLARRLSECLGVTLWRTDGARADGSSFGGTDRRWHSTEPCHPMLAVSRARAANAVVLVDEVEKAATRSDYGRLWDSLLAFLERETASAYPDPCLQVDLDLTHVSYIATANSVLPMPSALVDRFRLIEMPEPRASDLPRLVPPLVADVLAEQGLDARWAAPMSARELEILASKWKGGSVRRLRAYVAVMMRFSERSKMPN